MPSNEQILEVRSNIYDLMADAKSNRANGKYFAYKKCYCMLSTLLDEVPSNLK